MGRTHPTVKASRRYDSTGRQQRARERRAGILAVAEELLLRDGYAATTVAAIAARSGVSAETVYKAFGGKAGVVRAIVQAGLAGAGPVPAPERSDAMSAREQDADMMLRNWARFTEEVSPRAAPITLLVRAAAATDAEMARLLEEVNGQRLRRMAHNARRLARTGGLRDGVSLRQARDVMFTYTAAELYETLVAHRKWTLRDYSDFVYRGIRSQLLP